MPHCARKFYFWMMSFLEKLTVGVAVLDGYGVAADEETQREIVKGLVLIVVLVKLPDGKQATVQCVRRYQYAWMFHRCALSS